MTNFTNNQRIRSAIEVAVTNIKRLRVIHELLKIRNTNGSGDIGTMGMDIPPSITINVRRVFAPLPES